MATLSRPRSSERGKEASAMIRLGLCCIFRDEPIKFRTITATAIKAKELAVKQLAETLARRERRR